MSFVNSIFISRFLIRGFTLASAVSLGFAIAAPPVAAETANFTRRELSPGFSPEDGSVSGHTGGSYSLAVISNRDRNNNACLGYGDSRPDHILVLESDFDALTLQVDSGGRDTTLMIEGPDGFLCGEDVDTANLDDQVSGESFKAGSYSVWVGTMEPGDRQNYRLLVTESQP